MAPRPPSAVTRSIYLGTVAAIALVATLSVVIYRSAVEDAVTQHSLQQLAMVRTAAVAIQGEIQSLSARLRQFNSLPSVQSLVDIPVLSQRVQSGFGENSGGLVNLIVRSDVTGHLYYWTPQGERGGGEAPKTNPEVWEWAADRANANTVRMFHGWANSVASRRALIVPVWRTSPSTEAPNPANDFNGLLALVIDLHRFVEVYLGPAMSDLADDQLVVGLATPEYGARMGPGRGNISPSPADAHNHAEREGTSILADADGPRLHAWAKLDAAGETWLVASSIRYDRVAGRLQRSAMGQLALTGTLLIAVPLAGFLIARRERKVQDEQRRLERQLAESQKMEAIGKLAGGVAHDFNNMLTAILGFASMIHEDAPAGSPIREQAMQIRRAGESAATLTQKLLAFSRRQVLQANRMDFADSLENLLVLVRRVIGETIAVTTHADPNLWPILADPVQIEQSILNLAINARDAMPNGGTLQIAARNAPRPTGERRHDGDVKPGDYVQITVTDTGIGMDDEIRSRMFEPFFTTKPHGQGTGLGLSTVYGFVRQCGGYIGVLSTPGKGTSIELLLPRAPSSAPATPRAPVEESGQRGLETVLVVEDEDAVRELAVQSLDRHGYRVIQAAGGDAALELAAGFNGPIHLLLSDVVMPGMKGPELADRLRALRPGIRVLFMSGYAADAVTPGNLKDAMLMLKPFSPAALSRAVRRALDAPLSSAPASRG